MAKHNELGQRGENIAVEYLSQNGYKIVERNWRFRHLEIDVIAINLDQIVFVEVKSRSSAMWGNPEDSVSEKKVTRIVEAADYYLKQQDLDYSARFDIISILIRTDASYTIHHIEDAFYAPLN